MYLSVDEYMAVTETKQFTTWPERDLCKCINTSYFIFLFKK